MKAMQGGKRNSNFFLSSWNVAFSHYVLGEKIFIISSAFIWPVATRLFAPYESLLHNKRIRPRKKSSSAFSLSPQVFYYDSLNFLEFWSISIEKTQNCSKAALSASCKMGESTIIKGVYYMMISNTVTERTSRKQYWKKHRLETWV